MKRVTKPVPKFMTEHEIQVYFQGIDKLHLHSRVRDTAIFRLLYHHCLRRSEPGLLNLSDYRQLDGRLQITRKKGSLSGEYHLVPVVQTALRAYMRVRGQEPGPLFLSRNHRAIGGRRLDQITKIYCAAAGLPADKAHCHCFKHSGVTHFLTLVNGNIEAAKDHAGHADVRSTQAYAHFTEREKVGARKEIQEWGKRK
jgi:integrase